VTPRLYFDEDSLDQALIQALKARGLDVESALTAGMRRRSDRDQIAYATEQGRVLCSYNVVDFCRIHRDLMAAGGEHAGLILTQQHRFAIGEHLRRLLRLAAALPAEEMRNRLEFLSSW
jgi:hypothetical protein